MIQFLLWPCLILVALALAVIVVVARRQRRFELTVLKRMGSSGALLKSVVVALRASEMRIQ